ncbi:MAG TPA: hypothetical protein PLK90_07330 [Clostridiales bacterium]|nr:hypothetical protein [Clostridiales bacterium]
MRLTLFLIILFFSNMFSAFNVTAFHQKLIPDHSKVQFAGNQGFLSGGFGYSFHILRIEREIAIMYGYLPEEFSGSDIHIFSLKNTTLFNVYELPKYLKLKCSLNLSIIYTLANNTFTILPDYYPEGYYVSNSFHFQPSIGLTANFISKHNTVLKNISIYTELGILEQNLYHIIKTGRVNIFDRLNMSLGIRYSIKERLSNKNLKDT